MIYLRRSTLKRASFIALVVLLVGGLAAGVAAAATQNVTISTAPLHTDVVVYQEVDGDGIHDPGELVGTFDSFDGNKPITFSWTPYNFASGVNGSYRVSVWQNTTPLTA